ncbi:MAG: noncanonical pyrimidine nucleotidase, YjjG family [Bacteroidetes bacterium]|nr:noncanonical pyrimidine nucleotidase, YjjG family [Bacteroidota bacterium]
MPPRNLLLLDLDNTLWDFDGNAEEALGELFHRHKLHIRTSHSVHHFIETYKAINKAYWKRYEAGEIEKDLLRTGRFMDTFSSLGIPDGEQPENVWDEYLEICPVMTRMMPGAMSFVRKMKEHFVIVLLTNGFEKTQRTKINACGLVEYVDLMISSEAVGIAKPDKGIFDIAIHTAEEKWGEFNRVFYVGDIWETDVAGGVNAGIQTCWYNHTASEIPQDETARHPLFLGSYDSLSALGSAIIERL